MSKLSLKNIMSSQQSEGEGVEWYECVSYADAKEYIFGNITRVKENFVEIGYWLKYIRDNRFYIEDGFSNIWEFAKATYDISSSTASRWMRINNEFSVNGNSPELDDKFKEFSKSQLQEMIYLTQDELDEADPDMTVREIREIKKKNLPDDGTVRTFAQQRLRGKIRKKDYADAVSLKDYLYNDFGKSHSEYVSDELDYSSSLQGIVFNHLSSNPDDKISWSVLAKRILELYELDPLTLELTGQPEADNNKEIQLKSAQEQAANDILDGQLEIVNADMKMQEYKEAPDEACSDELEKNDTEGAGTDTSQNIEAEPEEEHRKGRCPKHKEEIMKRNETKNIGLGVCPLCRQKFDAAELINFSIRGGAAECPHCGTTMNISCEVEYTCSLRDK